MQPSSQNVVSERLAQNNVALLLLFSRASALMYEGLLFRCVFFSLVWQTGCPLLGADLNAMPFALPHE